MFGIINIFDLLALIAVGFLLAAVGMKIAEKSREKHRKTETKTWVATVKCPSVPDGFAESIMMDNRMYYESNGFVNAVIVGVREENAEIPETVSADGIHTSYDPSLKDVYVQLEIEDDPTDESVKVGPHAVCVGGNIPIKTRYAYSSTGLILELYEKQEE